MAETPRRATYERPVTARLRVVPDIGEPWDATPEDLVRFGLVDRLDAYARFDSWLRSVLGIDDSTESALNIIRRAVECAIMDYGHIPGSLGDSAEEDEKDLKIIRRIEAAAARMLEEEED